MRKTILTIIIASATLILNAQTVGYQGKRFMVSAGFSVFTNSLAIFGSTNYYDELAQSEEPVFASAIRPRFAIEGVASNNVSVFLKYAPTKFNVHSVYSDLAGFNLTSMDIQGKGGLVGIGFNYYPQATAAPLGYFYGASIFNYAIKSSFVEGSTPLPDEIANYALESASTFGLGAQLGTRKIFWDKVTFEVLVEASYLLNKGNTDESEVISTDNYIIDPNYLPHPNTMVMVNSQAMMSAYFTLNIGYLL